MKIKLARPQLEWLHILILTTVAGLKIQFGRLIKSFNYLFSPSPSRN